MSTFGVYCACMKHQRAESIVNLASTAVHSPFYLPMAKPEAKQDANHSSHYQGTQREIIVPCGTDGSSSQFR